MAYLTGLERGELEEGNADALQFFHQKAEVLEHHADLVLAAFGELDLIPGVVGAGQHLETGGLCLLAEERDARAELADLVFAESAVCLDDVGFDDVVALAHDGVGKVAIVGEEQQPLGMIIEAADGVDALPDAAQMLNDSGAALGIVHGRHHAVGLVHGQIEKLAGGVEELAVDLDVIGGEVGLGAKLGDGFAVDADTAFEDHFLGVAAAGDAGLGDDLLEAFERHLGGFRF